jgi:hypothetical protein
MTSFAFIFGVLPLVYAQGAGAEMRRSLGQAVFSGMLGVTLFGIFLTPVFYYTLQWFGGISTRGAPTPEEPAEVAKHVSVNGEPTATEHRETFAPATEDVTVNGAPVEERGQKTEDRGKRTEDRGQKTEDRDQP